MVELGSRSIFFYQSHLFFVVFHNIKPGCYIVHDLDVQLHEGVLERLTLVEGMGCCFLIINVKLLQVISNDESKRLNAVASSFQDAESIAKAIGNASKVVVTISKGEDGPATEVTTTDAVQVIEAAQLAGVGHVAIVYDESSPVGSTYNVLDGITSFFNNLFSKSQPLTIAEFLQKIVETDLSYTLIKTRLTDDFSPESSYKIVVSAEGSADADAYKVM